MEPYKQEFVELMVRSQVLQFGDFVTKSGRNTPFFTNTRPMRPTPRRSSTPGEPARRPERHYARRANQRHVTVRAAPGRRLSRGRPLDVLVIPLAMVVRDELRQASLVCPDTAVIWPTFWPFGEHRSDPYWSSCFTTSSAP